MDEPVINIIYDSRRQEKYEPLIEELKRQRVKKYEIWPCLLYPEVVHSINASHKMIVRKASEEKLKRVCIAEDDLWFPSENGWQWFLENEPEHYDIYAGGNYNSFKRQEVIGAVKTDMIVGFHLYMVHERYYDKLLSTPDNDHIDTSQKGELYFCYPMAALQRAGFSANNKSELVDYNIMIKKEDMYL